MRLIVVASCLALALSAPQKPADVYQAAIARYVADDTSAAFDLLRTLQPGGIRDAVQASVRAVVRGDGSEAARRRLEGIAMLHSEFALFGHVDERSVSFHIDMARLALWPDRLILERKDSAALEILDAREGAPHGLELHREQQRAHEFLTRWSPFAVSVLLTYGKDVGAATIAAETLKLAPDHPDLLFWQGVVLEFRAVWVGTPAADPHANSPMPRRRPICIWDMRSNRCAGTRTRRRSTRQRARVPRIRSSSTSLISCSRDSRRIRTIRPAPPRITSGRSRNCRARRARMSVSGYSRRGAATRSARAS